MSNLDQYFQGPAAPELHPRARFFAERIRRGEVKDSRCEFWRRRHGLDFGPARLFLFDAADSGRTPPIEIDWEPELDAELVRLKVKAKDPQNESERLGMMFGFRFGQLEAEYGNAFFNAVLYEQLQTSGFVSFPSVKEKLDQIHEYQPNRDGRSYSRCVDDINAVIKSNAQGLTRDLGYSPDQAKQILAGAIAYFLDEHYSITNRQMLGFK